ncbi:MAG: holo-ACP synthase [Nitrospirae bacterium]|nr:holo-ACP synthase [Nitrospirota bacterium]
MIIGMGIDIVSVRRIKETEARWGQRFLNRVFTEGELTYSFNHKAPHIHFAARFVSKESVMKALGTGHSRGVTWKDIEIVNKESGKPEVMLHGKTRDLAEAMGVRTIHVSIAHDDGYAIAQVILEGDKGN